MRYSRYMLFIAFLTINSFVYSQKQLLKNYDFDKGDYYLLATIAESDPNKFADNTGDFYISDIDVLNTIKKEWTFTKPSPMYACGYHYDIAICKNGVEIESFSINLNCNLIATNNGYFYFEERQLSKFMQSFKKIKPKYDVFNSLSEARNYRIKILKEKGLILVPTPDWITYEGTFDFTYFCPKNSGDCLDNEKKVLLKLTKEINAAYPKESFVLTNRGGSQTELYVQVECNKSLSDKFKLYKRDEKHEAWKPYELSLMSYWIANAQWYNLIKKN